MKIFPSHAVFHACHYACFIFFQCQFSSHSLFHCSFRKKGAGTKGKEDGDEHIIGLISSHERMREHTHDKETTDKATLYEF